VARIEPEVLAHLEWLGFVQPTGLVVSAPALVRAGAILDRRDAEGQRLLRTCVEEHVVKEGADPEPIVADFRAFAERVLGWSFRSAGYAGTDADPIPPELEVTLPDYGETLRPDFAVRERDPVGDALPWQLLVRVLAAGEDLDRAKTTTAPGAIVHTDRLFSYNGLPKLGYDHRPRKVASVGADEQLLPRVHRAISNLKAWMHGTHRRVSPEHMSVYLDEFVFRHNRRGTPMAGFQTLLGLGLAHDPITYREIINRAA